MKKEKERKHFIEKPVYPGGEKALTEFIYQNLRYPKSAAENKVEGTVVLEYDIDFQGKVVDTRVKQSLGHGCDEEAARVLRLLKFDTSKYRGMKVIFHRKAQIHFRPSKQPAAPLPTLPDFGQMQIQYTIVPDAPAEPEVAVEQQQVYSYTISF